MTDTPRTDAAAIRCACSTYVVPAEFAHQLELENAALLKRLEASDGWDDYNAIKTLQRENAALRAAFDAARKEQQ